MAFDPDAFLADKKSEGFDPDAFLASKETAAEPAMVAETQVPVIAPEPSAVPQLPVTGYGPGIGSQLASTGVGQTAAAMAQNTGKIAQPFATAGNKILNAYVNNPITKLPVFPTSIKELYFYDTPIYDILCSTIYKDEIFEGNILILNNIYRKLYNAKYLYYCLKYKHVFMKLLKTRL